MKNVLMGLLFALLVISGCQCDGDECYKDCLLSCENFGPLCNPELQDCSRFDDCEITCGEECSYNVEWYYARDSGVKDDAGEVDASYQPECWHLCPCEFDLDPNTNCQGCIAAKRAEGVCN